MAVDSSAAVGRPEGSAQVGAGDPETVIRTIVDAHVGATRHVTFDAEMAVTRFALELALVKMMLGPIIFLGSVALQAEIVPKASGTLFLRLNDSPARLDDNAGKVTVTIQAVD